MDGAVYSSRSTALGKVLVGATPSGVCFISLRGNLAALQKLGERFGPAREARSGVVVDAVDQLEEFLAGRLRDFDIPMDLTFASPFTQSVLKALVEVPFGKLTTYGAIARKLQTSSRAVGRAVGANPIPVVIPCHRVVAADGTLGGYTGGLDKKRKLLRLEGHPPFSGGWKSSRDVGPASRS